MTEDERKQRIHYHEYDTLEGIHEHAERIVELEELVDLMYGWLLVNHEKHYVIPRPGLNEIERKMREFGIEVDDGDD